MAVYTATVTKDHPRSERISRNLSLIMGKCDITIYSATGLEITDITKYFDDTTIPIRVINDGLSDNGYITRWSTVDKCFHAFYPSPILAAHSHDLIFKANAAANAVTMAANSLRNASAGDLTVVGAGADGGIAEKAATAAAPGSEVGESVDVGEVNFIAIGWGR